MPITKDDISHMAVLVVDVIEGICAPGPLSAEFIAQKLQDAERHWDLVAKDHKSALRAKFKNEVRIKTFPRGNAKTQAIAAKIQSNVSQWRDLGMAVYAIRTLSAQLVGSLSSFYCFKPEEKDVRVEKYSNSCFEKTSLDEHLKQSRKTILLVCGFSLNACIRATVMNALRKGYQVYVLTDLCGNDQSITVRAKDALYHMRKKGAVMMTSEQFLAQLTTAPIQDPMRSEI